MPLRTWVQYDPAVRLSYAAGGRLRAAVFRKGNAGLVNYISDGVLSEAGIRRACVALTNFRSLLHQFGMEQMHVFATASLRNIRNTEEAVAMIRDLTGIDVDVISGDEEAQLGYYGAMRTLEMRDGAMFDIGGGSTEIVEVRDGRILRAQSLPIGSLNLFNRYVSGIWPKRRELEALSRRCVRRSRRPTWPERKAGPGVRRRRYCPGRP